MEAVSLAVSLLTFRRTNFACSSTATGFYWLYEDRLFMITNWHCVTGLNTDTNEKIGKFFPTEVEFVFHQLTDKPNVGEARTITRDLYENEKPIWIEHPLRNKVDCVAIPLPHTLTKEDIISKPLNSI